MRVLVTGAAGFIGSHVSEALLEEGHQVKAVDSIDSFLYPSTVKLRNIQRLEQFDQLEFLQVNLLDDPLTDLVSWSDVIIHEAALPGLTKSWSDFDLYVSANLSGTRRLLDAIVQSKHAHLVYASTSSVYGRTALGDENSLKRPSSPYGVSKLAAENLISAYSENFGVSASILRYFSVYGPRQRPDMAYAKFCQQLIGSEEIHITGDGTQSRSNTFIDDIVHATLLAANAQIDGLVANICGSESMSLNDALSTLAEHLGVSPQIRYVPKAPGDQYETKGDASLACRVLDWKPMVNMAEGLRLQAQAALVEASIERP